MLATGAGVAGYADRLSRQTEIVLPEFGKLERKRKISVDRVLLVRAGDRSVDPVRDALMNGVGSPELVDVLASIGSELARRGLESVGGFEDEIGEAARQALRDLDDLRGFEE